MRLSECFSTESIFSLGFKLEFLLFLMRINSLNASVAQIQATSFSLLLFPFPFIMFCNFNNLINILVLLFSFVHHLHDIERRRACITMASSGADLTIISFLRIGNDSKNMARVGTCRFHMMLEEVLELGYEEDVWETTCSSVRLDVRVLFIFHYGDWCVQ